MPVRSVVMTVEGTVTVAVSVLTKVTVDTDVDGIPSLTVAPIVEVEVGATAVTVCVVATAEMHAQADE